VLSSMSLSKRRLLGSRTIPISLSYLGMVFFSSHNWATGDRELQKSLLVKPINRPSLLHGAGLHIRVPNLISREKHIARAASWPRITPTFARSTGEYLIDRMDRCTED